MDSLIFFYGTLLARLNRPARRAIERHLSPVGLGSIAADLFDLGTYPVAVPSTRGRVWGEVCYMKDPAAVLPVTDEAEAYRADDEASSLYVRRLR